eukprot:SAG22_NODE_1868_length_3404_cov_67.845688_3_plen_130_part_00
MDGAVAPPKAVVPISAMDIWRQAMRGAMLSELPKEIEKVIKDVADLPEGKGCVFPGFMDDRSALHLPCAERMPALDLWTERERATALGGEAVRPEQRLLEDRVEMLVSAAASSCSCRPPSNCCCTQLLL